MDGFRVPKLLTPLLLKRGLAFVITTPVPSIAPSSLLSNGIKRICWKSGDTTIDMTSTAPTYAHKLGKYAKLLEGEWSLEPAAALESLVPTLGEDKHKGQEGRVGVFGGSKDYTGAPFFASMSALRMGADLAYVLTAEEAAPALKTYSPELMVTPVYSAATVTNDQDMKGHLVDAVGGFLPKLHSLLLGPGMGRDPMVLQAAAEVVSSARARNLPLVLDADSIAMVIENPEVVRSYPNAVLTPNANEFRLLCERMDRDSPRESDGSLSCSTSETSTGDAKGRLRTQRDDQDEYVLSKADVVRRLATFLGGTVVVLKGKVDVISDGTRTLACAVPGGFKRCGGIGDVLSGVTTTALAWVGLQGLDGRKVGELRLWATWWACAVTRHASRRAYTAHGRAMSAIHVLDHVGLVLEEVAPSPPVSD